MAEKDDGVSVAEGIAAIDGEKPPAAAAASNVAEVVNAFKDEDAELAELTRLVEEEAAAGKAGASAKADDVTQPAAPAAPAAAPAAPAAAAQPAKADATNQQPKDPPQVAALKHALFVERGRRQKAEQTALVLHGQNEVLTAIAVTEGVVKLPGDAPKAKTPAEELAEIDNQIVQLAQDYDDSKIGAAEQKKQERALEAKAHEIRLKQLQSVTAQPAEPATDLGLEEHLQTLLTTYPVLGQLAEDDLKPFEDLAYKQAEREGKPIQPGPLGTKDLRERMGKLATNFYGAGTQPAAAPAAAAPGPQPAGATPPKQPLSPEAQARDAKLNMAANHPPDISRVGSAAPGGEKTEGDHLAALNAMGGDEDKMFAYIQANPGLSKVMSGVL